MITLYGSALSNYYNKVKLSLLEKGVPFTEEAVPPSRSPEFLEKSPMGKIPVIRTEHGYLTESHAMVEYIDTIGPKEHRLMPADPWQAAQVRAMMLRIDAYIDGAIRRILPAAFFGGTTTPEEIQAARQAVDRGVDALERTARFSPYLLGDQLTYADLAAITMMPLAAAALQAVGCPDPYANRAKLQDLFALLRQRPHVQKVEADGAVALKAMMASRQK